MLRKVLLTFAVVFAAVVGCRDTVPLPPVEGPPLSVPESRSGPGDVLAEEQELTVIHTSPVGQLDSPHLQVTVSFSKPMVALDKADEQMKKAPVVFSPAVAGQQRWLGTRTLVFENTRPLAGSTTYTVTVPAGVAALDGSKLAEEKRWTFTTPRLQVARVYPYKGSRWQRPNTSMELHFNQDVAPQVLAKHLTLTATPKSKDAKGGLTTIELVVRQGKTGRHMVIKPKSPLPLDSTVALSLDKAMVGMEGELPMLKPWGSTFSTYGPFRVKTLGCTKECDPSDSVRLSFTNPVRRDWARGAVRVNGKKLRAGRSRYTSDSLYIDAKLGARKSYAVTVKGRIRDQFGQPLQPAKPLKFATGDYRPMVYFPMEDGMLEPGGAMKMPLVFRNAEKASLTSKRLDAAEVAAYLGHKNFWDHDKAILAGFAGVKTRKLKVGGRPNKRVVQRVDLRPMLSGKAGKGMLALELSATLREGDEQETRLRRALVRVTDLALTAKYSPHATLVWVTSLATGKPVADATVTIWRKGEKKALWDGITDKSGLVKGPGASSLGASEESHDFLFFAEKAGDISFVGAGTQNGISPWDFGYDATWDHGAASTLGLIFTDRGLYRPGEQVFVKGIVRRQGPRGLVTPADEKVTVTVSDGRGEELDKRTVSLSEFGTFSFDLNLAPGAPLGSYSVLAKPAAGGSVYGRFSVEEYRAAEFKVDVSSDKREYLRGETMTWNSTGRYLFGAPMRKSKLGWSIYRSPSYFAPPKHEGFTFSDEVRWWGNSHSPRSGAMVARGRGKLDKDGGFRDTSPLQPPPGAGPQTFEVETTVTDVSRQTISSRKRVLVHPGPYYAGAKPKHTFLSAGEALEAEVVAADPKGKRLAGVKLLGTLYRREWISVRKKGMGGSHYFVTRPKDTKAGTCPIKTSKKLTPCKIKVPKAGYYVFKLEPASGPHRGHIRSSFSLYASGSDYVAWRRDSEDRVELVKDRKVYKVGQTARILVKSPFENAHGLMTVERNGIYLQQPFTVKRTSTWLNVPITRDLQPNAYVSVVLVRGRIKVPAKKGKKNKPWEDDPGKPTFKVGYAQLKVSQADRRLKVGVKPAKEEYRPGQQVTVDLSVTDHAGKGTRAELTVIAADEGVLTLMGYKVPNPMDLFYAPRGLSVRTADNRIVLLSPRVFGEKGNNPGGGGGEMGASGGGGVRSKFVSTPYFNPSVITDDSGKARVQFTLPDNLTTFRIMAVAVSRTSEFGNGRSQVRVNKPLLLLHSLPRFVRVGDKVKAGVVVHNHSGQGGDVTVTAKTEGLSIVGDSRKTVAMTAGGSAEARFDFDATKPGMAKLTFVASLGDHSDALELKREVKLPLVMETVATYGSTERAVAEGVMPARGVRDDVGGMEVALSSSALVGLKAGLEYLMDYPYECLEQSTSRLVPLVLLSELRKAFDLGSVKAADALADKIIARIQKMQRWNGGFAYWPSSHQVAPWVSAYATWGLHRAQKQGRKVSKRVMDKATRYLKGQLKAKVPKDDAAYRLTFKAFAAHVLTELGQTPTGYFSTLFEHRSELPLFARALLLSAMVKGKADKKMVKTMTDELLSKVHQTARAAKVEENLGDGYAPYFHSSTRSTAMVLDALLAAEPNHMLVEKLVRHLLDQRKNGRWRNTQETAYALLGIHRYFKVREKAVPDFVARVFLGETKLIEQEFRGRSLTTKKHAVPMAKLLSGGATDKAGTLGFVKDGPGRLYYSASLRYARAEMPKEALDAGFYVQRTYEQVNREASSLSGLRGKTGGKTAGVAKVKAGDMVRVRLRIIAPQQMHFVAVDDPLPAGLEAVNFKLMTASRTARRNHRSYRARSRYGKRTYSSPWHTPFYQQQMRDDRVQLFADRVSPGVYEYVYLARATTAGTFAAPPTHVEQMYEPEVFGRTGGGTFEITP